MDITRVFVFKEITQNNQNMFLHFRIAQDDEEGYIVPHILLNEEDHLALMWPE